jgi:hypothetical protein
LLCVWQAHWTIYVFPRPPWRKLQVRLHVDFHSLSFLLPVQNELKRLHNMRINIICVVNHAWALSLSTGICLCLCKFLSICVAVHWILLLKMSSLFMRYMVCWPRRNYQIDQKINECSFLFCRLTARWLMWLVFLWYVSGCALFWSGDTSLKVWDLAFRGILS